MADGRNIDDVNDSNHKNGNNGQSDLSDELLQYLKHMSETLDNLSKNCVNTSQSAARDQIPTQDEFRRRAKEGQDKNKKNFRSTGRPADDFLDSFEDAIWESFLGSGFKDSLKDIFGGLADAVGVDLKDTPGALGKELGDQAVEAFSNSGIGKAVKNKVQGFTNKAASSIKDSFLGGASKYDKAHGTDFASKFGDVFSSASAAKAKGAANAAANASNAANAANAANAGMTAAATGTAAAGGTGALASGATAALANPYVLAAVAAIAVAVIALEKLAEAIGPAVEGFKNFGEKADNAMNRYALSRMERQKREHERLVADVNAMVSEPFEILKDAAQKLYDSWDSNVRKINATQGYTKADLQDLYSSYSSRLRSEGLSSVVSSADIISSLSNVLDSGLSGKIAEEFAFLATRLNAAIPTQDFFSYADVYASLAAQAIQNGQSEAQAIAQANAQLETFASNILYANRQVAGGFTTGLRDASKLLEDSVQIAAAARTNNASEISGVLASISAIVGGVAPDLTSGIVDAVVKAATGGNSSEIVALRSLAGVNAGNTAFLQKFAADPQGIFETLFRNLANMQAMSVDNYMEVAEGLSSVFGISMNAFARVDFNRLADAISEMSVNNAALNENLEHLKSGETTTTAEQMRMAQINKYMIEEGLAYVLDNEVARSIQEHMWEEQLANEMMEATYGVELRGATLQLLEGLAQTVQNIVDLLNPFSWIKKLGNLIASSNEANAMQADLVQMLQLGKVGQGNATALYQLTTRGIDLNITDNLIDLMGRVSAYEKAHKGTQIWNAVANPFTSRLDFLQAGSHALLAQTLTQGSTSNGPTSRYTWNTVGKSVAAGLQQSLSDMKLLSSMQPSSSGVSAAASATEKSQAAANAKLDKLLEQSYMEKFVEDNNSADEWLASAKSLGIADLDKALEQAGYTRDQLEQRYMQAQSTVASKQEHERKIKEENFWERSITHFDYFDDIWSIAVQDEMKTHTELFITQNDLIIELTSLMKTGLDSIYTVGAKFYSEWMNYFVNHKYYDNTAGYDARAVGRLKDIKDAEQSDAVYKLADVLTAAGLDLKDPQMQTNALLAEILIVANKILQSSDKTTAGGLVESLQGLALGLVR